MNQPNSKPGYNNIMYNGFMNTGQTPAQLIIEDIATQVMEMTPNATPILELSRRIGRGAPPKNHRVQQIRMDQYDPEDRATRITLGTGAYTRYARLEMAQPSRPTSRKNGIMFYQPQDRLRLQACDLS